MNMCSIENKVEVIEGCYKIYSGATTTEKDLLPHIYWEREALDLAMEILRAVYRKHMGTEDSGRIDILFDGVDYRYAKSPKEVITKQYMCNGPEHPERMICDGNHCILINDNNLKPHICPYFCEINGFKANIEGICVDEIKINGREKE